jgi:hypothetical protein
MFTSLKISTNEVDTASSSLAFGDDREAVCYLCLGGGFDKFDKPLRNPSRWLHLILWL